IASFSIVSIRISTISAVLSSPPHLLPFHRPFLRRITSPSSNRLFSFLLSSSSPTIQSPAPPSKERESLAVVSSQIPAETIELGKLPQVEDSCKSESGRVQSVCCSCAAHEERNRSDHCS
ncbi:hypothetical protein PFISCL1PPCAC_22556, partial [Pristionchus fissidentatus]